MYADRELDLNLVPQSVYDMQSAFYPTIQEEYGVPLDTRHVYTKGEWDLTCFPWQTADGTGDWELFTAAVASAETRDMFLEHMAHWIDVTSTNHALTDLYDTKTGGSVLSLPFFAASN